jgi:hypothetical protein
MTRENARKTLGEREREGETSEKEREQRKETLVEERGLMDDGPGLTDHEVNGRWVPELCIYIPANKFGVCIGLRRDFSFNF